MTKHYRDANYPILVLNPKDLERPTVAMMKEIKYRPYGQHPMEKLAKKILREWRK